MNHQCHRLLFLTKYSYNGASSRYRTFQYLPGLEQAGYQCRVMPLFDEAYLEHHYRTGKARMRDILRAMLRRVAALVQVRRFDLLVVEYELVPYFPAFLERWLRCLGVPYVVDYDDALFHQYDRNKSWWVRHLLGKKISCVMRGARLVTVGNEYLADYARRAGADRVEVIPTVVDLECYRPPLAFQFAGPSFTIGWIGSPTTAKYLEMVADALGEVCANGDGRLQLIGSGPIELPCLAVEVMPWDDATEVDLLKKFDVGIMPLPDEPWERGKCGLKLIQYMACGLPVVASPVGVNSEIVEHGVNGFLAESQEGWVQALRSLRDDPGLRQRMGQAGRKKVEERYSLQLTGPRLAELLKWAADTQSGSTCR
jgi:glycosyltransferase involved in cell wall biosynthesis